MQNIFKFVLLSFLMVGMASCKSDVDKQKLKKPLKEVKKKARVKVPVVNADSIYTFVEKQVSFGPRVPETEAHTHCKKWLKKKFESFGAKVTLQDFEADIYTGQKWASSNIIAQINPNNPNKILLTSHWDSRMMAENDKDPASKTKPIDGADDGASGVAILLEIARVIQAHPIDIGVDIVLFDAEDQGSREHSEASTKTWCKGSQYWSKNTHYNSNNRPLYGILLDMVGAEGATFYKEGFSSKFAPAFQNKIWSLAQKMNSGKYFINQNAGAITDDHYYVNVYARIPMVDIIHLKPNQGSGFGAHWHTHDDNIHIISRETLKKVGQLVTAVTYKTSDNSL